MMTLEWRQPDPPIITQWRGPDARIATSALSAGAPQLAALIGPPGLSPLSGRFALSMNVIGGVCEHSEVVTATGVTPAHTIFLTLAPTGDADENCAEMIDLAGLSGSAGSGNITVSANFLTPISGMLILNWSAL